jgi:PAS domain-containing protein
VQQHVARTAVVRYGVALASVAVAVVLALWLRPLALAAAQLLLVAVLITGWVSGLRPALVAWSLATMSGARRKAKDALKRAHDDLEARVRDRTARFRDLVNSVEGIVWEADATTFQFSFVSDQAERILGYPVGRWLSEPTFWKDHLHPDDREWVVPFCERATERSAITISNTGWSRRTDAWCGCATS